MISVVLYGRNDSYGYNLHKRGAISLNCLAEVLTDPADELIFVDYNTPDDFPTFPEAIQDTLTPKAKSLLRILRVRPSQHERFREKTHLVALEPIARNVAIRRSNPQNRWILSTNTDMVFVPRTGKSLSQIVESLPDAYYHLPRFEVPETLWESVNRLDPVSIIQSFSAWGRELHLNEIVYAYHEAVRYDGPGDFQLILRKDLWRLNGFHEEMLLGWHVDSNIARRLSLLPLSIGDIVEDLYGYHCDHTRQVTPAHKARAAQNDQKIFFENVKRADIPEQAKTWGLANETIEEIRLGTTSAAYLTALYASVGAPLKAELKIGYSADSYNRLDYTSEHVVPFLADSLSSYPRNTTVAWLGAKRRTLECFASVWQAMGFSEPILVFSDGDWLGRPLPIGCAFAPWERACELADVFVFDWGRPEGGDTKWGFDKDPVIQKVTRGFRRAVRSERNRSKKPARRFIGVNTINNAVEAIFNNHIGAAMTPLATHIRQGFLTQADDEAGDLLPVLHAGGAGQKLARGIVAQTDVAGYVFFGPFFDLDPGAYSLRLDFTEVNAKAGNAILVLEVVSDGQILAYRGIGPDELCDGTAVIDFSMPSQIRDEPEWSRVEFRLRTSGTMEFTVSKAVLKENGPASALGNVSQIDYENLDVDLLRLLFTGTTSEWAQPSKSEASAIRSPLGRRGFVAFGPYMRLEPGDYRATFELNIGRALPNASVTIDVVTDFGTRVVVSNSFDPSTANTVQRILGLGQERCQRHLAFSVAPGGAQDSLFEFRVQASRRVELFLTAVRVQKLSTTAQAVEVIGAASP